MIEKDENIYEIAKIKVIAVDKKIDTIRRALSNGRSATNHITSIVKMVDLNSVDQGNITQATPTSQSMLNSITSHKITTIYKSTSQSTTSTRSWMNAQKTRFLILGNVKS